MLSESKNHSQDASGYEIVARHIPRPFIKQSGAGRFIAPAPAPHHPIQLILEQEIVTFVP
jgi:hypothetical protein